jgi:hypothetical protein
MTSETGCLIDWNGNARGVQDAGGDFVVGVDLPSKHVALHTPKGTLMHEATFHRTLDDIARKGVRAELVPGSHPWGLQKEWQAAGRAAPCACRAGDRSPLRRPYRPAPARHPRVP